MSGHSQNSASVFARRIACPGSRAGEEGKPDTTNIYAATGTAAHWLGEQILNDKIGTNVGAFIGKATPVKDPTTGEFIVVDVKMAEAVDVYVDYCRSLMAVSGGDYYVEEKFPLLFLGEDEKGQSDFVALYADVLEVVDYKNGVAFVDAVNNVQGLCYGLGASRKFLDRDWRNLKITIVQPNCFSSEGTIRSWEISRDDAEEYLMEYAHAAHLTWEPDAPRVAGPHCKYCKAQPCYAQDEVVVDVTQIKVHEAESDWVPRPIEELSNEVIADLILAKKLDIVEAWCQSVRDTAKARHESGQHLPGMKIVQNFGHRKFKPGVDPVQSVINSDVPDIDIANLYKPQEPKTLAQIEKAIGKKVFAEIFNTADPEHSMVHTLPTGTALVPEDDKRPLAKSLGSDDFGSTDDDIDDLFD